MKTPKFKELTKSELKEIENLFQHYLFYETLKNGDRRFECSACKKEFLRSPTARTITPRDRELMSVHHNDKTHCPICGAAVTAKNLKKAKSKKNLWARKKVVIIHAVNQNRVEARCFYAVKDYEWSTTPKMKLREISRYLFTPGSARKFEPGYYSGFFEVNVTTRPFPRTAMFYGEDEGYTVLGFNRLQKTFLKYNQLDDFIGIDAQYHRWGVYNAPIMKYLSYFTLYPQIEMLQKLGHYDIVRHLVNYNRKSFPYVNWKADKITDFFKMSKQEYKEFRENGGSLELLRVAYSLRQKKKRFDFFKADEILRYFNSERNIEYFKKTMDDYNIPFLDGYKYVSRKTANFRLYTDYLSIADRLCYDLSVHNVAFPKELLQAHDNAAAAEQSMLEERKKADLEKAKAAAQKYLKKYDKQYSFTDGNYIISVPHTVKEIIDEGKNMHHCVGGYAGRHMQGTLAILFLRSTAKPDKSLYTIEMHNKDLTQVQGFHNETPLTPEAKAFFDEWLNWVKEGSKRTKNGEPILKTH